MQKAVLPPSPRHRDIIRNIVREFAIMFLIGTSAFGIYVFITALTKPKLVIEDSLDKSMRLDRADFNKGIYIDPQPYTFNVHTLTAEGKTCWQVYVP